MQAPVAADVRRLGLRLARIPASLPRLPRRFSPLASLAFALALRAFAGAPVNSPAPLAQIGKPDAAETVRILEQFRHAGFAGYFEFELHALPRRGAEKIYRGRMWGGRNEQGAIIRLEVNDGAGLQHRLLLQNGLHASAWRLGAGKAAPLAPGAILEPLIPGVEITAFEVQMPYLYWPDASVDSITRVWGRPAYAFLFRPPAGFAAAHPELTLVRAYFDTQFSAPTRTEEANPQKVVKTIAMLDLKKIGDTYFPKAFDVRNELTRDKTRFQITAVALNAEFDPAIFSPDALAQEIQRPAQVTNLEP